MPSNDDTLAPRPPDDAGVVPTPAGERDPEILIDHIREISETVRASLFWLLALLAFVGFTMLAHKDVAFFVAGFTTEVPFGGVRVATKPLFITVALLLAGLYMYLHLQLVSLWDELGDAPERIGPNRLFERVHPGIIAQSAVLYRSRARPDGSAPPHAFGDAMAAIMFLLLWLATPALLTYIFWRSMALHSPALTLWIGACLVAVGFVGFRGARISRGRLSRPKEEREKVHAPARFHRALGVGGLITIIAVLCALAWETTRGGLLPYEKGEPPPLLVSADISEAELTPRPPGWRTYDVWIEDFDEAYRDRQGLAPEERLDEQQAASLKAEAWQEYGNYLKSLVAPDLTKRDLRKAILREAFLPSADLRGAQMQGADLSSAQMQGANVVGAQMQGAIFEQAEMQKANFENAQMQRANLSYAGMQRASFYNAQMQGANLRGARMQGANFHFAQLKDAQMQGADLSGAVMMTADLRGARMQGSNCKDADFRAALVHSAVLSCREKSLTQEQLRLTVGDDNTILPENLHVWSCLKPAALSSKFLTKIEKLLARYPEEHRTLSRAEFEGLLYCDEGQVPHEVGRHPEPAAAD
ncbi:MAG: pentapeptide repeat-containing protein [Nitrococcus sp.]|nr:pentapeptide repeat-containing protein [Nitrococcus sp.]